MSIAKPKLRHLLLLAALVLPSSLSRQDGNRPAATGTVVNANSTSQESTSAEFGPTGVAPTIVSRDQVVYVPGQIVVKFSDQTTRERVEIIVAQIGGEIGRQYRTTGLYLVTLPPALTVEEAKAWFEAQTEVDIVEEDLVYRTTDIPNDPEFDNLWAMHNTADNTGTPDVDINAPEAWVETTGSRDFVIGHIDTGVSILHPDLQANLWINPFEIAANATDDDGNGYIDDVYGIDTFYADRGPEDLNGHGTHVAGTIAAVGNNGINVAGVMWDAEVLACRAFGREGDGRLSSILECIEYYTWAKDSGIDIFLINASWGGSGYSELLYDGLSALNDREILFVAAAGNDGRNVDSLPHYPSSYDLPNIVSVGAIDRNGRYASFSNYGSSGVDIAAPGKSIFSLSLSGPGRTESGTSMAAPHVSGALALIKASAPSMSAGEVRDYVLATGEVDPELASKVGSGSRLRIKLPFVDLDGDLISDRWERRFGLDPGNSLDAALDFDGDGLSNLEEYQYSTDPTVSDSDADGLADGDEINIYGTDPNHFDSDDDGLSDGDEVNVHASDPLDTDSDDDGLSDDEEVNNYGTNPVLEDSDGDGMVDNWELQHGLDPLDPSDRNEDVDNDGLTSLEEHGAGTDPNRDDTDGDGLSDGEEVSNHGTDPLQADSDFDEIPDNWELVYSLDPLDPDDAGNDADQDGYSNREEHRARTDPNDAASTPPLKPWSGSQGSSSRRGFIPLETDISDFTVRWSRTSSATRNFVYASQERHAIFVENADGSDDVYRRLDSATGLAEWEAVQLKYATASHLVVDDRQLYYVSSNSSATGDELVAHNKWTGEQAFKVSLGADRLISDLAADGGSLFAVKVNGLSRYDSDTGAEVWTSQLQYEQYPANHAPAVTGSEVVTYAESSLHIYDRATGAPLRTIELAECYNPIDSIAVDLDGAGLVQCADQLLKIDLDSGAVTWQAPDVDGQVEFAVGLNELYVAYRDGAKALSLTTGEELWRWESEHGLDANIVATLDHVFVQSDGSTFALDSRTGSPDWEFGLSGYASISYDGALLVQGLDSRVLSLIDLTGDRDDDGLDDWWEQYYSLDMKDAADAAEDGDGDGLTNLEEHDSGTSPVDVDSDGDQLGDGLELNTLDTDPTDEDSDNDGLGDGEEINLYGTDPNSVDTDGDLTADSEEVGRYQTDPLDGQSVPSFPSDFSESFENGIPADWIVGNIHGFSATNVQSTDGSFSLLSDQLDVTDWATIEFQVEVDNGEILFDSRLVAPERSDSLDVYIDDQEVTAHDDESWSTQRFSVLAGSHTIKFVFHGPFGSLGRALIDNIRFQPALGFGAAPGNVLVVEGNRISEYSHKGDIVRGPLIIPGAQHTRDLTVTEDHHLVIADPPNVHFFDPFRQTFKTVQLPNYRINSNTPIFSIGESVLVGNADIGGVYVLDADGDNTGVELPGRRFSRLRKGTDGYIYGLSTDQTSIFKMERVGWQVVDSYTRPAHTMVDFVTDSSGQIQTLDANRGISFFDDSFVRLKTVLLDSTTEIIDIDRNEAGDFFVGGDQEFVIASADVSRQTLVRIVRPSGWRSEVYVAPVPKAGVDNDGDMLPDWWEHHNNLDWSDAADATTDADADGLNGLAEFAANTDASDPDTDDDGIADGAEVNLYGTSPLAADSDFDDLGDSEELFVHGTNPLSPDTDGDGVFDGIEVNRYATSPLESDTDGDGLDDRLERAWRNETNGGVDADVDNDADGLTNLEEFLAGTDADNPDSDGDHLLDGEEISTWLTDPLNADTDGDYMADGWETAMTLAPLSAADAGLDADGDGFSNKIEFFANSSAADFDSEPIPSEWFTDQGSNAHRGYVPALLQPEEFSVNWTTDPDPTSSAPLRQPTQWGDRVFVTSERDLDAGTIFVAAVDRHQGGLNWHHRFPFPEYWRFSPVATDGATAYTQSGNHSNSFLFGINNETGEIRFQTPLVTQGPRVRAPAVANGLLFTNTGSTGGVGGFDTVTGGQLWYHRLSNRDGFSPAHQDDEVFAFDGNSGILHVFDQTSGAPRYSINARDVPWQHSDGRSSPVIGTQNNIIIASDDRMLSIDLASRRNVWNIAATDLIPTAPAVANGRIFYVDPGYIVALDERTGMELWRWELEQGAYSDIVAVADHIFVATELETYAINIGTAVSNWHYPAGGQLSIGRDLSLYIAGTDGTLTSIATQADSDADGMPDRWEAKYGLDSADPTDAATDLDNDQLTQLEEYFARTNPHESDTDGDGLTDHEEVNQFGTHPTLFDSDQDGLSDGDEAQSHGTDPLHADTDGDGIRDDVEIGGIGTSAVAGDSDGDGFSDRLERSRGSDPGDASSVPRRVTSFTESFETGMIPSIFENGPGGHTGWRVDEERAADGRFVIRPEWHAKGGIAVLNWEDNFSAGLLSLHVKQLSTWCCDQLDLLIDGQVALTVDDDQNWTKYYTEVPDGRHVVTLRFTRLQQTGSVTELPTFVDLIEFSTLDADGDGMRSDWEIQFGLDPNDATDATGDADLDGLNNLEEFLAQTSPVSSDTDGDSMPDLWEIQNMLDPLVNDAFHDPDADSLENHAEHRAGTSPNVADTDADGMPDGWEVSNLLDPLTDDSQLDPDQDGASNIAEYNAGTNPHNSGSLPLPPRPPPSGGGGGGLVDAWLLMGLLVLLSFRLHRVRRERCINLHLVPQWLVSSFHWCRIGHHIV